MNKLFSKIIYGFIIFILVTGYPFFMILASDTTYVWSELSSDIPTSVNINKKER